MAHRGRAGLRGPVLGHRTWLRWFLRQRSPPQSTLMVVLWPGRLYSAAPRCVSGFSGGGGPMGRMRNRNKSSTSPGCKFTVGTDREGPHFHENATKSLVSMPQQPDFGAPGTQRLKKYPGRCARGSGPTDSVFSIIISVPGTLFGALNLGCPTFYPFFNWKHS